MIRRLVVFVLALSASCLLSTQVMATPVPAIPSLASPEATASGDTMAYQFHVLQDIQVTALGFWDYFDNGLNTSHDVGLWTSSGSLLASVTVPSGTTAPLENHFRYVDLPSPVDLASGSDYRVGAFGGTDYYPRVAAAGAVTDPRISLPEYPVYRYVGGFAFPAQNIASPAYLYVAGNFKIVPEPSTGIMLGLGLLGVAALRRRSAS